MSAASIVAEIATAHRSADDAELDQREAECLAGYEKWRAQGKAVKALSRVRSFAMTVAMHRGFARVLGGHDHGWREVERWWLLETATSHWIGAHIASGAHVLLAYALALGEDEAAEWLGADLRARMAKLPEAYESAFFPRFVAHLHRVLAPNSKAGPGAIPELGPYDAVLQAWDDPPALARALVGICEHRLTQVVGEADDEVSEFRFAPILPVEIAAVATIRRRRGEVMPEVDHPLMRTPLAAIPTTRSYDPHSDAWFGRAVDAAVAEGRSTADFRWPPGR
jgi:hypothetical protein